MQVEAIWLRTIGGKVQVLFEHLGKWRLAIEESAEPIDTISHIAEHPALEAAPIDVLSESDVNPSPASAF
jgi:hypothetical protein